MKGWLNLASTKCQKCGYEFDGQSVCDIYYHECKLSDIPKVLQDSLGIDDDNKHR